LLCWTRVGINANVQARSAWDLRKAWGDSLKLQIVDDAGHSAQETGIKRLLVAAADEFGKLEW
jgi:proline iminopeptidase